MIPVSDEYKQAIKEEVRNFDIQALLFTERQPRNVYIETTSDLGSLANVLNENPYVYKYAILEQDYTMLDGSFILPNRSDNEYLEFIGTEENNNSFSFYTFQTFHESFFQSGTTIVFDKGYATNFTVSLYTGSQITVPIQWTLKETRTYTNDKEQAEIIIPDDWAGYRKMIITINEWSNSNQPRIKKILNKGIVLLNNDDIVSMKMLEQTDLRGLDIPSGDFSITVDNYNRQYNVLDPNNIINRLDNNSIIKTCLGLNINGAYEYIYLGLQYFTSYKENSNKTIDFNFDGEIGYYYRTHNASVYDSSSTISNAIINMFGDTDSDRADYITYRGNFPSQYLPYTNKKEHSQEDLLYYNISAREKKEIDINRLDKHIRVFNIDKINENIENYTISLNEQIRNPSFNKVIKTKTMRFNYYTFGTEETSKTEIYNAPLDFRGQYYAWKHIYLDTPIKTGLNSYDVYRNETKIVNNGYPVSGSGFTFSVGLHGYYEADFTLNTSDVSKTSGTFKVEVTTYKKLQDVYEVNSSNVSNGATIEVSSNVIKDTTTMDRIANTIFNYENAYPFEFETEIMGDIRLEVGDRITLQSLDGYHTAIIQSIDTKYNGGLTQIIKGVCSDVLQ